MIFNKLRGHWSLVTCTFTLSLMYSIRFYAEKIGGYENKLQICNAINEIFSHLKLMSPICEDRRHFFVSSVGAFSFLQLAAPQHCKSKNCIFSLLFAHLALTFLRQVRLRFGIKNESFLTFILYFAHLALTFTVCKLGCGSEEQIKKLHFFFALRSPCTNFHGVQVRLHLSSPNKKNAFFSLYCVRFALTFLRQVRLRFGIKNESFFDFHFVLRSPCTNFAVQKTKYSEKGLLCEYTFGVYNW